MLADKFLGRFDLRSFVTALARRPFPRGAAPLGFPGPRRAIELGWHRILPRPAPLVHTPLPRLYRMLLNMLVLFTCFNLLTAVLKAGTVSASPYFAFKF